MSYKGKYSPSYPKKYKGDPTNIIYRSLWERKFLYYCDVNENVLEYSSEEMFVWYKSPVDGKPHRYYPDMLMKVKESNGTIKKYMIENFVFKRKPSSIFLFHAEYAIRKKDDVNRLYTDC